MAKLRIFISFDYDHDQDIKTLLAGQAQHTDSPFDFTDASVKDHLPGDWKEKVKRRLSNCDQMIVLCGEFTHTAKGVAAELQIAQAQGMPYFLLWGRTGKKCTAPVTAKQSDKLYNWTWNNLKNLINGAR